MTLIEFLDKHTRIQHVHHSNLKRAGSYIRKAYLEAGHELPPKVEQREGRETFLVFDYPETEEVIAMMHEALREAIEKGNQIQRAKRGGGGRNHAPRPRQEEEAPRRRRRRRIIRQRDY